MKGRVYPGDLFVAVVVLLPVLVAVPSLFGRLEWSWVALALVLGQLAGIFALSTFLAAAMLAARIPGLDRWFGGLIRIWHVHRWLGGAAFLLIMLHVLLLALAALPLSLDHSVGVLFPTVRQWEIWAGWAGFITMLVFIAPTFKFFGRLNYQRWKRLHVNSVLALLLALTHVLVLSSTPAIWWMLTALAVAAIVWRKVLSPWLARKPYRVDGVEQLTRDVVELKLSPKRGGMTWRAGQFVYLTPLDPSLTAGYREEHPYTISSSPDGDAMRIGIKAVGDATEALRHIAPGAEVRIEGPYGSFLDAGAAERKQLWVGGGIGITPFVAGFRERRDGGTQGRETTLFYLANRPERAYYLDELEQIANACEDMAVYVHYLSQEGVLTPGYLAQRCPDFAGREVYLCGPPGMINHVRILLRHEGVPEKHIHTEAFDFL